MNSPLIRHPGGSPKLAILLTAMLVPFLAAEEPQPGLEPFQRTIDRYRILWLSPLLQTPQEELEEEPELEAVRRWELTGIGTIGQRCFVYLIERETREVVELGETIGSHRGPRLMELIVRGEMSQARVRIEDAGTDYWLAFPRILEPVTASAPREMQVFATPESPPPLYSKAERIRMHRERLRERREIAERYSGSP